MDLLTLSLLLCGFVALICGAEVMVRGASRLAEHIGISPLVVGLTVVAFGTSAPELGVSVLSAYSGQPSIAIGNVVGSNIANVLLILGLSALAAPLVVPKRLLRVEVPLVIGASLATWAMAYDGIFSRAEGFCLFSASIAYTVWSIKRSRRDEAVDKGQPDIEAKEEQSITRNIIYIVSGLILLGVGSNWLVNGAVETAKFFGVSDLLIGLTIVSIGTSLPELATSIVASIKGQTDIAVGNIVGSNLFNILVVLGFTSIIAPTGIAVSEQALHFDLKVMVAVVALCLPLFYTGLRVSRLEGAILTIYYVFYTFYHVLNATGYPGLPTVITGFLWTTVPLVLVLFFMASIDFVRTRAVPSES